MSRFFSDKFSALEPYTPGEQPQEGGFVKLNTNESAFPPSPKAIAMASEAARGLNLYSDPKCAKVIAKIAELYGLMPDQVFPANGSDEALNFAFGAFCDSRRAAVFPDITYGFYPVFAGYNNVAYREIPILDDLSIRVEDYLGLDPDDTGAIVIANPNAPTSITMPLEDIERIVASNPEIVVIVDEAYVDFGGKSAIGMIDRYENLIVVQTFSKSRSLAGARLGFAFGNASLIADLNTLKYSTNPYNVNSMTIAAGVGALEDEAYTRECCQTIIENRGYLTQRLRGLGFELPDSTANFVFAKHPSISGQRLYEELKERKILIRHFSVERISDYNRITVGTLEQIDVLLAGIEDVLSNL